MTGTTKTIFEKYQVRKSKKQKSDFIEYVKGVSQELGYDCNVEKGSAGAKNIFIGQPDSAKVIYTAHYDTCARLPFPNFITPKNIGIYILYNIALVLAFAAVMFCVGFCLGFGLGAVAGFFIDSLDFDESTVDFIADIIIRLSAAALMILIFFGPANKNTANDNTSGVTVLLDLMAAMPQEQKEKCAFVFFDLEEAGLFGSSGFSGKHKKVKQNTLVINFDCVSDGDNFIFTIPKKYPEIADLLENTYRSDKYNIEILKKGYIYPSDQANFKKGVGVAALNRSKRFGFLYMDRIHTKKDVIYQEENIEFLVENSVKLAEIL